MEVLLVAAATDSTCRHRDALDFVERVRDAVKRVATRETAFHLAANVLREVQEVVVVDLLHAMRGEVSRAAVKLPYGEVTGTGNDQPEETRSAPKEPSAEARAAYQIWFATGKSQTEIARTLSKQLGRDIHQGTVSRYLDEVRKWFLATGMSLDQPDRRAPQPTSMDPSHLDLGKRQDGLTPRQRQGRPDAD
jgi:hypothetical protein